MKHFRSFVYYVYFFVSCICFGGAALLLCPVISYRGLSRVAQYWGKSNLFALRGICNLRYRVSGMENLPALPTIVLCKHQSTWETIALRAILPIEQTWVLKKELTRIPVFGWALKCLAPIAIDRSAGPRAITTLLKIGKKSLAQGRWVVMFPEGTRVLPGQRGTYNLGGAFLAQRSGQKIVPIAHNAGEFWSRRSFLKSAGTIDLVIGPQITTDGKSALEINQDVEEWIEGIVASLPNRQTGPNIPLPR
jgi:1-acyl-sn-glycerol-3-phosphate acyltransferase